MRKLAILTLFLFPLFVFGQKWSQVTFKNNDGKNEKKWVYKVSGKFKDYEKRGWNDFGSPKFKIKHELAFFMNDDALARNGTLEHFILI